MLAQFVMQHKTLIGLGDNSFISQLDLLGKFLRIPWFIKSKDFYLTKGGQ